MISVSPSQRSVLCSHYIGYIVCVTASQIIALLSEREHYYAHDDWDRWAVSRQHVGVFTRTLQMLFPCYWTSQRLTIKASCLLIPCNSYHFPLHTFLLTHIFMSCFASVSPGGRLSQAGIPAGGEAGLVWGGQWLGHRPTEHYVQYGYCQQVALLIV